LFRYVCGGKMPKIIRPKVEPTSDWEQLQLLCGSEEQIAYELLRPVVLFGQTVAERARQTKKSKRTLNDKAHRFLKEGMVSLFEREDKGPPWQQQLPEHVRQFILALKAEYASFSLREMAEICGVKFGQAPDYKTVQRVLKQSPTPVGVARRFPPYHEMPSAVEGRKAILTLYEEGWRVKSIAAYLLTSRQTVYATLERGPTSSKDGEAEQALADKSRARTAKVRKVDFATIELIRAFHKNEKLGSHRMSYQLKQAGINLSPRTCGRIMARLDEAARPKPQAEAQAVAPTPEPEPKKEKPPKEFPFKAQRPHQYWSVDVRYIEKHRLGSKPLYVISILDNYSRAILASLISPSQDQRAFLKVLYEAIVTHGVPEVLVSDSGAIFVAKRATAIYAALCIKKVEIEKRMAWQNLIETNWNVQRKMADYYFERAQSWEALVVAHENWVHDFNYQDHWAHQANPTYRRSPAAVLGLRLVPLAGPGREALDDLFIGQTYPRKLNLLGYVRFRDWQLYGERGLAKQAVVVRLLPENLSLEFKEKPLADYEVEAEGEANPLAKIQLAKLYETDYAAPQLTFWPPNNVIWRKVFRRAKYQAHPRPAKPSIPQLLLPFSERKTG